MPCYQVNTISVELGASHRDLLIQAIESLGLCYTTTSSDGIEDIRGSIRGRDDQHSGAMLGDPRDGLRTAAPGKVQVEERHLGGREGVRIHALDPLGGIQQRQAWVFVDGLGQALPVEGMILDDDDRDHLGSHSFTFVSSPWAD